MDDSNLSNNQIGPYKIKSEVGEGAFGKVYIAERENTQFALKLLKQKKSESKSGVINFRKEATQLARLHNDHLVRLVEAGEDGEQLYMIQELVEGTTLRELIKTNVISESLTIDVGISIANALVEMDRLNLVHRDIKPENIILKKDKTIKLVDLGLAADATSLDHTREKFVGTITYSSPEQLQVLKRPVDIRSDLYSLGLTLYECLAGRATFSAEDPVELMNMHASVSPTDLLELNPKISVTFAKVIHKLVNKDPEDRYQSPGSLVADLKKLKEGTALQALDASPTSRFKREKMFGRDDAQKHLINSYRDTLIKQKSRIFQIEGEGGLGKTFLAKAFVSEVSKVNTVILYAKAKLTDSSRFLTIREMLTTWLRLLIKQGTLESDEMLRQVKLATLEIASALKNFSPEFRHLYADVASTDSIGASAEATDEQALFIKCLAHFMIKAHSVVDIIFCIDDIQWLDAGSAEVIHALIETPTQKPLCLITTSRNDKDSIGACNKFSSYFESRDLITRISLQPFTPTDTKDLTTYLLGGISIDSSFFSKMHTMSDGNPFAVGEFLRAAINNGVFLPKRENWDFDLDSLNNLSVSKDVISLILKRLQSMPSEVSKALKFAATIGSTFDKRLLTYCLADKANVDRILELAIRANLIEEVDSTTLSFVHDRIFESVLSSSTEEEKVEISTKLAQTLYAERSQFEGLITLAAHCSLVARSNLSAQLVFDLSFAAGISAVKGYAYAEAARFLSVAKECELEIKVSIDDKLKLLSGLGESLLILGKYEDCRAALFEAAGIATNRAQAANISNLIQQSYQSEGKWKDAWEEMQNGLRILGFPLPKYEIILFITTIFQWLMCELLYKTKWNPLKNSQGWSRQRLLLACRVYNSGLQVAYFMHPVYFAIMLIKFRYVSLLSGEIADLSRSAVGYAAVLSYFFGEMSKNKADNLIKSGIQQAEITGDKVVEEWARSFAYFVKIQLTDDQFFLDNYPKDRDNVFRYGDGYSRNRIIVMKYASGFYYGHYDRVYEVTELEEVVVKTGASSLRFYFYGFLFGSASILGDSELTLKYKKLFDDAYQLIKEYPPILGSYCSINLFHLMEQNEFSKAGDEFEKTFINGCLKVQSDEVNGRLAFIAIGYYRYYRWIKEEDANLKKEHLEVLKFILKEFKRRGAYIQPVFRQHYCILNSMLARAVGNLSLSKHWLESAKLFQEHAANDLWGRYEILLESARYYKEIEDNINKDACLKEALRVAAENGWGTRAKRVKAEFNVTYNVGQVESSGKSSFNRSINWSYMSKTMGTANPSQMLSLDLIRTQKTLDSLLEINLTSVNFSTPEARSKEILSTLIKLMNAERAYLFIFNEAQNSLSCVSGLNSELSDITAQKLYSQSLINKCFQTSEIVFLTSDDAGRAVDISASISSQNIKSVICAPINIREKIMGVIYLDSTMSRGLFTEEHADMINAMSSQIGISYEIARTTKIELEKVELKKKLEAEAAISAVSKKFEAMVQNMAQAVFCLDGNLNIVDPVSKYSEQILGENLSGKNILDSLYSKVGRDSESFAQAKSALITILGEDMLQWELSSNTLPGFLEFENETKEYKALQIKYYPIYSDDQLVNQLLFVIEDKTEDVLLERKAKAASKKAEVISLFASFDLSERTNFIRTIDSLISSVGSKTTVGLGTEELLVFKRELHTIKGNSRIFGLKTISTIVHDIETELLKLAPKASKENLFIFTNFENLGLCWNQLLSEWKQVKADVAPLISTQETTNTLECIVFKPRLEQITTYLAKLKQSGSKSRLTDEMQSLISASEHLFDYPLNKAMQKYSNMISEIATTLSKKVAFEVAKSPVGLAPDLIKKLDEPIVHLIRNSLDHGIETIDDRLKTGKNETGKISITFQQQNQLVTISISDDGKGIDHNIISKIAVDKKILTQDAANKLSEKEKIELIFAPGFSSKQAADDLSGRGLGMDIVKTAIEHLGGNIEIQTNIGQGTSFRLNIPQIELKDEITKVAL